MNLLDKKRGPLAALLLRCRVAHLLPATAAALAASVLATSPAHAQGSGVLTGTILDTATKRAIPDVVVTVTSPSLQGEQTVVTDKSGSYRIPNLPPGAYTLRAEGDGYKPYTRGGIGMRIDTTLRVNAELLPEGIRADEVVVVGKAPTVDVGSSSTGITINQELLSRVAVNPPGGRGGGARSFEAIASLAPGAVSDQYGVSIAGTTSPENAFLIDGVSVSDPAFGILGTPLTMEFVKEMSVITGGYLPEYGKAMGGIMNVVTKSGSNEFHGQAYFNWTPGQLEGRRSAVTSTASSVVTQPYLGSVRDFGADVGGPIIKDKLWFFAGVNLSFTTDLLERNINQFKLDPTTGAKLLGADGLPITTPVTCGRLETCAPGTPTSPVYQANQRSTQFIGKLTYLINQDHNLTLSVYGTPSRSGGNGSFGFDQSGQPLGVVPTQAGQIYGSPTSLMNQYVNEAYDASLKYAGAFNNKHQLLDVTLGWHHQHTATLAADGSGPDQTGNPGVQAGVPQVQYAQNTPAVHSLTDFESVPRGACPIVAGQPSCPTPTYTTGGPGYLQDTLMDSYQGKVVFTDLLQLAGHHVIKAGVELNFNSYKHDEAFSGGVTYHDTPSGAFVGGAGNPGAGAGAIYDYRDFGFATGPDSVTLLNHYVAHTTTTTVGGFLQDSWQILDKVTLNIGFRYDAQVIYGADGTLGLTLPNQWSPRVGVIYDFTQQGRSKIFANYARYYEGVPLDVADRSFPGTPQVYSFHNPAACNPLSPGDNTPGSGSCTTNTNRIPVNSPSDPSQLWNRVGGSREAIDPNIQSQSSDEFVVGGEYELFSDARLSLTYTHRWLVRAMEDMSRDEGNTYFLGNPGYGIAADFPQAVRTYDALTASFTKVYSNNWLFSASYVLSRLYGNYAGLFRPETGQLDPNITTDFDLKSLLPNQMGLLPGDHTHAIKIYGAKDFPIPAGQNILLGLAYRGLSGPPLNAYGAHVLYGADEVFVLPRGTGGRLTTTNPTDPNYGSITEQRGDWVHNIDLKVGYSIRLSKATVLGVNVDVFNLFNFQASTLVDQRYTTSDVLPCQSGTVPNCIVHSGGPQTGTPFNPRTEVNPNYGRPLVYQDPRQFRFGAKVTF